MKNDKETLISPKSKLWIYNKLRINLAIRIFLETERKVGQMQLCTKIKVRVVYFLHEGKILYWENFLTLHKRHYKHHRTMQHRNHGRIESVSFIAIEPYAFMEGPRTQDRGSRRHIRDKKYVYNSANNHQVGGSNGSAFEKKACKQKEGTPADYDMFAKFMKKNP